MFELGKVGFPMLLAGYAYTLLVGRRFLPRSQPGDVLAMQLGERYLAELIRFLRTAAFFSAINKIAIAYQELGIFP